MFEDLGKEVNVFAKFKGTIGKIVVGALVLVLVGAAIYASGILTGATIPTPLNVQTTAHSLGLDLKIYLLSLGLAGLFVFSLLESEARGDFILLDFFASWGLVILLVAGQLFDLTKSIGFWGLFEAGILAMVAATFWNPAEEGESKWWNKIDTTHWYVTGLALIFIYLMGSPAIPYPTYIPIFVPVLVAAAGMGKEFFRQVEYSLVAFAIGLVPALLQTVSWMTFGLAVEMGVAIAALNLGMSTVRNTSHTIKLFGRGLQVRIAWDIILFYIAEVVLIGYALYGNYPVLALTK